MTQRRIVHGTTVALDGLGVLLLGPSGSGKSDLALRLIDDGAALVSDDLTELERDGAGVVARPPAAAAPETRGRIEVRGLGIVAVAAAPEAPLALVVDLAQTPVERLPEPAARDYLGVAVPRIVLRPFEASAAAKLRAALRSLCAGAAAERPKVHQ